MNIKMKCHVLKLSLFIFRKMKIITVNLLKNMN